MREIEISQHVRRLIRANARGNEFQDTGRPAEDLGFWLIQVDEDVVEYLEQSAFPGESYSDVIERLFAQKNGQVN